MASNNKLSTQIEYRKLFLIFGLLTLRTARALAEILLNCGQLTVQGYNSCEIEHNNEVFNYMGPAKEVLAGPFFGLITYKCDRTAGYLISHVDCEKCNFECSEEGQTKSSCPTDAAQFWMGLIFGGVLSILIGSFVYKRFPQTLDASSWFKSSGNVPEKGSISTIYAGDQVIFNRGEEGSDSKGDAQSSAGDEEGGRKNGKFKAAKKALVSMVAGLVFFKTGEACDVVIIMASSNNVTMLCQGSCETQVSSFIVQQGQQICVEDHFGERVTLQITDIIWSFRYELAYYTSDYVTKVTVAPICCLNHENCLRSIPESRCIARSIAELKRKTSNNITARHECLEGDYGGYERHVSCSYFAELERKGEVYNVFRLKNDVGIAQMINITATGRNHSQLITMKELDPTYTLDLTQFKLRNIDKIPITVMKGAKSIDAFSNALLQYEDKFYYIHSSNINEPTDKSIGDFQIHLNEPGKNYIPDAPVVVCNREGGCGCECSAYTDGMINKFKRQKNDLKEAHKITVRKNDSSVIIDTFERPENRPWELKFGLSSSGASNLKQMQGKCDISHSYGFTSNEGTYLVLGVQKIEKTGLIPFHSNCTFDRNSIKCDHDEPTKLVLKSNQSDCLIRLPTMNKTLIVNATYANIRVRPKGQLNCTESFSGYGEAFVHLVTGTRFIGAVVGTMFLSFISALLANFVLKFYYKRNLQLYSVEKQEHLVDL